MVIPGLFDLVTYAWSFGVIRYALAYDDKAFFIEAGFLEQLAHQVINQ